MYTLWWGLFKVACGISLFSKSWDSSPAVLFPHYFTKIACHIYSLQIYSFIEMETSYVRFSALKCVISYIILSLVEDWKISVWFWKYFIELFRCQVFHCSTNVFLICKVLKDIVKKFCTVVLSGLRLSQEIKGQMWFCGTAFPKLPQPNTPPLSFMHFPTLNCSYWVRLPGILSNWWSGLKCSVFLVFIFYD